MRAVERSLSLLLALQDGPLTVSEAAQRLRVDIPATTRLLGTLRRYGLVELDPGAAGFALGPGLARLGNRFLRRFPWAVAMQPDVQALAEALGETATLSVRAGRQPCYHTRCGEENNPPFYGHVGGLAPWHAGSVGKAILAFLPQGEMQAILARTELRPFTANTSTAMEPLLADLRTIRERGYAVCEGEIDDGCVGVAAPIFDAGGHVVGSLAVNALDSGFGPQRRRQALNAIRRVLERQGPVGG